LVSGVVAAVCFCNGALLIGSRRRCPSLSTSSSSSSEFDLLMKQLKIDLHSVVDREEGVRSVIYISVVAIYHHVENLYLLPPHSKDIIAIKLWAQHKTFVFFTPKVQRYPPSFI